MNPDLCSSQPTSGLIATLLANTDCQASGLVERGYSALSSPGAATAAMLTSLMVIAIALYGYRLLLGHGLNISEVVRLAIQLGVVLLLAASWSSFQSLAYDAVAREPSRIASELIVAIEAPAPLAGVQIALDRIEQANVGWRTRAGIASPLVGGAPTAAMALNASSFLLTLSTVGILVVSRVLLSLLLAITPIVAGFLLFNSTRGLLEGWLRAMATAAMMPLFVLVLCAIELSILSPLLDQMLGRQARGQFELDDVTPVSLVVIVFSLAILASVRAAASIGHGIRLVRPDHGPQYRTDAVGAAPFSSERVGSPLKITSGGLPVVQALEAAVRRDSGMEAHNVVTEALRGDHTSGPALPASGRQASAGATQVLTYRTYLAPARPRPTRASRAAARRDL